MTLLLPLARYRRASYCGEAGDPASERPPATGRSSWYARWPGIVSQERGMAASTRQGPSSRLPWQSKSGYWRPVPVSMSAPDLYLDRGTWPASQTDPRGARQDVPAIIDKVLRAGEGKILRRLQRIVEQVNSIEEDYEALTDAELRALTDEFKERHADRRIARRPAPRGLRRGPRGRQAHARPAALRRPAHGRRRPALREHRRDEDR